MAEETGTLSELKAQMGDLVECMTNNLVPTRYTVGKKYRVGGVDDRGCKIEPGEDYNCFRLVSRVSEVPPFSRTSQTNAVAYSWNAALGAAIAECNRIGATESAAAVQRLMLPDGGAQ